MQTISPMSHVVHISHISCLTSIAILFYQMENKSLMSSIEFKNWDIIKTKRLRKIFCMLHMLFMLLKGSVRKEILLISLSNEGKACYYGNL